MKIARGWKRGEEGARESKGARGGRGGGMGGGLEMASSKGRLCLSYFFNQTCRASVLSYQKCCRWLGRGGRTYVYVQLNYILLCYVFFLVAPMFKYNLMYGLIGYNLM